MIITVIPSMLCFPSFLTISYGFPWCLCMFPMVFLRLRPVFLQFPLSVFPPSPILDFVRKSTVFTWLKSKEKILSNVEKSSTNPKRKKMRSSGDEYVDKAIIH